MQYPEHLPGQLRWRTKRKPFSYSAYRFQSRKVQFLYKPGLAVLAALYVDTVHATKAFHQCAAILIAFIKTGIAGFFARFARWQGIGGGAEGAGKADGGAKDKDSFLNIDHFYPIPKVLSRYKNH